MRFWFILRFIVFCRFGLVELGDNVFRSSRGVVRIEKVIERFLFCFGGRLFFGS